MRARNQRKKSATSKDALSSAERDELARLRRRVRQLEMERDILAKATAWFAGNRDATSKMSTKS
jgi:transposase